MTNLDYIYILENMLVKWKVSLRDLIRQVVKKGLNRMNPFDFNSANSIEILSNILETNLSDKQFEMIKNLINSFRSSIEVCVQNFINWEIDEFKQNNPHAEFKEFRYQEIGTFFGKIKAKTRVFRNAEFSSIIIKKKSKTFFLNTMFLASLIVNGLSNYDNLIKYFKSFNITMYDDMICNVRKTVNAYLLSTIKNDSYKHNPHQLVVFFDGCVNVYKTKIWLTDPKTGLKKLKTVKRKVVTLTAIGIDANGVKRTLAHVIVPTENSNGYDLLMTKLKEKGIEKIDLIVADGTSALNDPIMEHFPRAVRQRCVTHMLKHFKDKISKKNKHEAMLLLKSVFKCESLESAKIEIQKIEKRMLEINPNVWETFKKNEESMLAFFILPKVLWKASYTNNVSENFNSCFRKLSPSYTCFSSFQSLELTVELTRIKMDAIYKKYDIN